jgi:hypothetical protein
MSNMKLESVSIKRSEQLTEKWVQEQIAGDPSLLGLGNVETLDRERRQPSAGRLDLLLQDVETLKRYEVEIQLGDTDESHVVRTVEYWDIERKRYPQYEHAAVIVAEEITARFLNVIQLFNGAIPLIALKMTAYKVGDQYALTFVKVLDERTLGLVGVDEPLAEPTNRDFWESKSSKQQLLATDALLKLVNEVEPKAALKYNRQYIGLGIDGAPMNFVTFRPQRSSVIMTVRIPLAKETDDQLKEVGIEPLAYQTRYNQYRLGIESPVNEKQRELLLRMVRQARDAY